MGEAVWTYETNEVVILPKIQWWDSIKMIVIRFFSSKGRKWKEKLVTSTK